MHGTFDDVEQFTDVVVAQTRLQTEIPGPHLEPLRRLGLTACVQSNAQDIVDGLLKRLARFAHLRLQLGAHVFVKSQGGSHIMMLCHRHHDVKSRPAAHATLFRQIFVSALVPRVASARWAQLHQVPVR